MKSQRKARAVRAVRSVHTHHGRKTDGSSSDDLQARVALVAYALYERRGREDGHDVEDWIQAEKTILEENASPPTSLPARL
jgi:hypothetical protein